MGTREYLQVVCNYPDIVRALLRIKLKRLNYRNNSGVLCSTDDHLYEGIEFLNCPSSRIKTISFPVFVPSSASLEIHRK